MNKYKKNYINIVSSLITTSFSNLKDKKIFVIELNLLNYSASTMNFPFFGFIAVAEKSRKYTTKALRGLFAHELSHLSIIEDMDFLQWVSFSIKWTFSRKARADFETKADMLVIKKGHGKDLIELKKQRFKGKPRECLEKVYNKGYLSVKEIKQEMRKLK
jgi:hypothetical protein